MESRQGYSVVVGTAMLAAACPAAGGRAMPNKVVNYTRAQVVVAAPSGIGRQRTPPTIAPV
jgi:hypothetical protein